MKHVVAVVFLCQVAVICAQEIRLPFVVNAPNSVEQVDELPWNEVGDLLLGALKEELTRRGKEGVVIPDIHKAFQRKKGFIKLNGVFEADHGWFKNLSSIQRTADVVFVQNGTTYTVTCALGLADMEVGYDHYQVRVSGVKINGHMSGSVGANSIELQIAVHVDKGACAASLLEVRVVQLDDVRLDLTGFGVLNGLVTSLANKELDKRKPDIIAAIEKELREQIVKALTQVHC